MAHRAHRVARRVVLVAQYVGVMRLVEDDTARTEQRDGVELELDGGRLQLLAEVLEIGNGGVGQELEQVVV